MSVVCKFKCTGIEEFRKPDTGEVESKSITLEAKYDENDTVNKGWSKWTPSGDMRMNITNPDAFNQFEEGKYYLIKLEQVQ